MNKLELGSLSPNNPYSSYDWGSHGKQHGIDITPEEDNIYSEVNRYDD